MTTAGLTILILSVSTVTCTLIWCVWKILTTPGETEKVHGIEPPEDHTDD